LLSESTVDSANADNCIQDINDAIKHNAQQVTYCAYQSKKTNYM